MPLEGLSIVGDNQKHGTHYDPSPIGPLRDLIRRLGVRPGSSFVDFGCGKARTLMVAAHFPFCRVVGIEFARELAAIGSANVAKYAQALPGLPPMEVRCEDATRCAIDPEMGFFYLFNPFDEAVIHPLLANIRASVERHPREIWILYGHPVCKETFDAVDWLEICLDEKLRGRRFVAYRLAANGPVRATAAAVGS